MSFATRILLAAAVMLGAASASAQQASTSTPGVADFAALLRTYPGGGEGLMHSVEDMLMRDSGTASAADIARHSHQINCDQAAAVALGASHAIVELKKTDSERVARIYETFVRACTHCKGPPPQVNASQREKGIGMCRLDLQAARDPEHPNRIKAIQGDACFCSMIASLAAQIYAQGQAGPRMGFFPDQSAFSGGGLGSGPPPASSN